jgi:hypothetical protein
MKYSTVAEGVRCWLKIASCHGFMCAVKSLICFFVITLVGVSIAGAQDDSNQWQYSGALYIWGADLEGRTADDARIKISFSDLVDNLEIAFMGAFAARKREWTIATDVIYMDISSGENLNISVPIGPGSREVRAKAKLDLTGTVVQLAGGYDLLYGTTNQFNILAGVRYLDLDTDVKLNFEVLGTSQSLKASESGDVWDGIVGFKGRYVLADRWALPYYLDVGTGDSDLTYQTSAGISYAAGESFNVALLYRYLKWEFDSSSELDNLSFEGPMLGGVYRF